MGIKIERLRNTPYVFNFNTGNGVRRYEWAGSKNGKYDTKELPQEAVDYLLMNSICFKTGDLRIIEDNEEAKEVVNYIVDVEEYKNNTHTREDIEKLLKSNTNTFKKELNDITSTSEIQFIVDVAKEIGIDSVAKQRALAEKLDIPMDILFEEEE